MHILLSNDDGYRSPGLRELAAALAELARVTVVAPREDQSVASSSLTVTRPLRVAQIDEHVYAVDGTPTDCVHLGLTGLIKDDPPAMVVSGINFGENLGDDVIYSGTVAAAMEGWFLGFPSLAVSLSLQGNPPDHLATAVETAVRIVRHIMDDAPPGGDLDSALLGENAWPSGGAMPGNGAVVLNVNVPNVPRDELKGLREARLGKRHFAEPAIEATDPRGETVYWVGAAGREQDAGPGTDFHAVRNGFVSVTPLHADLTRHASLPGVAEWLARMRHNGGS